MKELEKIIKYIDGDIAGSDKEAFELEIASNSDLKKTVELIGDVEQTLKDEELAKLINTLNKVQYSFKNEKTSVEIKSERFKFYLGKKFLAAASITAVIIISSLFYYYSGNLNDKLFKQYYAKYEADVITRSGTNESNELIIAIQLYDNGKYEDAISKLDEILKKDYSNSTAHFFKGIACMETKSYEKAIQSLMIVKKQNGNSFQEHAEWYLALCYIKTRQPETGIEILKQIANSQSYYRIMSGELLKKLK